MAITSGGDEDFIVWATPEHKTCTRHRLYALSCEQFEALLARAAGHCEICGAEGEPERPGCCLYIDHEHNVGMWAVRGLLCYVCNCSLQARRRIPPTPEIKRYVANVWYRQELKRLGLSAEAPPEPGLGSTVLATGVDRSWIRLSDDRERCWLTVNQALGLNFKTWQEVWYATGPMNLEVFAERDRLPNDFVKMYGYQLKFLANCVTSDKRRKAVDV